MNGTQVSVLKESNKVGLSSFLEGKNSRSLEAEIRLEVLGNLTNKTLEGKLSDEEVSTLLVTTDLTKGDSSRAVTMGLLDSSGSRGRLTGSLGCQLLTRGFSSSGFTSGLLSTSHWELEKEEVEDGG